MACSTSHPLLMLGNLPASQHSNSSAPAKHPVADPRDARLRVKTRPPRSTCIRWSHSTLTNVPPRFHPLSDRHAIGASAFDVERSSLEGYLARGVRKLVEAGAHAFYSQYSSVGCEITTALRASPAAAHAWTLAGLNLPTDTSVHIRGGFCKSDVWLATRLPPAFLARDKRSDAVGAAAYGGYCLHYAVHPLTSPSRRAEIWPEPGLCKETSTVVMLRPWCILGSRRSLATAEFHYFSITLPALCMERHVATFLPVRKTQTRQSVAHLINKYPGVGQIEWAPSTVTYREW
ncbi:hypothetical protein PsYK624_115030 [Phanerochaete sordida]|uniref:Uncharacterized protein n=1 Tax=Phanerochaete sordida TaxID=48140 RepID=A0A9P3LI54_9APHY|nr:hypothetical protein PsYK624_115030 [Phanerochaete sordida]